MDEDKLIEQVRKSILRRRREESADEWFSRMISAGVINEKGEVLVRMPEPPEKRMNGPVASKSRTNPDSD